MAPPECEDPFCRICWDAEDQDPGGSLLSPCACSGTMKWVHFRCLRQLCQTSHEVPLGYPGELRPVGRCPVCHQAYQLPADTLAALFQRPSNQESRRRGLARLPLAEEVWELLGSAALFLLPSFLDLLVARSQEQRDRLAWEQRYALYLQQERRLRMQVLQLRRQAQARFRQALSQAFEAEEHREANLVSLLLSSVS